MKQEDFNDISYELLMRFFAGECNAEEVREIEKWKSTSDTHANQFAQAKMAWIETQPNHFDVSTATTFDTNKAWNKVKANIQPSAKILPFRGLVRIAAMLILVSAITLFVVKQFTGQPEYVEVKTDDVRQDLELVDGSKVELNTRSQLTYEQEFSGNQRVVRLQGEAFFDIERDTTKPFVIKTADIDIRVLGTRFNVDAMVADSIEVQVESGIVELVHKQQKIRLEAGETGVFYKNLNTFIKRESRAMVSQFWRNRKLIFRRTTLEEIIETLNTQYEVDIELASDKKHKRKLNVRFEDQDIDLVLDILSNTLNLKLEKHEDGKYTLYDAE